MVDAHPGEGEPASAGGLAGVYCALVTPFDPAGSIDDAGLERVVDRVVRARVAGICPAGSTGEGMRLSAAQRLALVRKVRSLVPPGMSVIPSPSASHPPATAEEIRVFAEEGADAVLVAPPASYRLADDDVLSFYETIAEQSPLPIVLYHIPDLMGVGIAPKVAARLASHPRVVGVKDSSRQFEYTEEVVYATSGASARGRDGSGFAVLTGSDTMLMATMLHGGTGAIAASANLVPDVGCALYEACDRRDWDEAGQLQERLFHIVAAVRRAGGAAPGWKAALQLVGIGSGQPAPPATPVVGAALEGLRARLSELGVLPGTTAGVPGRSGGLAPSSG
jgi:dihydrodipicolinate synthase/N-acetylneuraminate lyase